LLGAEKVNAGGTDVAGDEGDRKIFRHTTNAAKPQGKFERGARIFAVFRVNSDGMRGHADEAAGLVGSEKRRQTQCGDARGVRNRPGTRHRLGNLWRRTGGPQFRWS
jgi:hypothetical protein